MPEYEIGRTVFGSAAEIAAAYDVFRKQTIDETRLAPTREDPFGGVRRGLKGEASITDVATFDGREESTLTFDNLGSILSLKENDKDDETLSRIACEYMESHIRVPPEPPICKKDGKTCASHSYGQECPNFQRIKRED